MLVKIRTPFFLYLYKLLISNSYCQMPLHERTSIPHWALAIIGLFAWAIVLVSCACTYILLNELRFDITNPIEVCEKINNLKPFEICAHFIMAAALMLRGWWVVGLANFPFLYFHLAQCVEGEHIFHPRRVYYVLAAELILIKAKLLFFSIILVCYWLDHAIYIFAMARRPVTKLNTKFNFFWNSQISH
ncbi:hypothetical protein CMESO_133 (nucleomorph) [Chroomonas mesostigmatica CCMP1168]|uniref:Uncharacterized protein n=1 Tax=Chroomonas mesostigmatica CCMP1168 TaxID=1195612 RepID=J7G2S1_9CRYP|nr:hypothetical protein CMESO_133 [Chroomonas mesostigmatica CCMP1168]|mmetsp:Transcript_60055/g.147667  ORF Transcript_60055/g.147667 Transcript_60055/m.147667 type:complete len:189 (-) Transcript_60055:469-1035(-)